MASSSPPSSSPSLPIPAGDASSPPSPPVINEQTQRYLQNDPARTGFDPETKWWMSYFRILTGRTTPEGIHHYREWRYRENEARDCAACERHRDYLLRYSPVVRFLAEKVEALNGRLDASNVVCRRCPTRISEDGSVFRQGGGFNPHAGILICANEIRNRKHLEDVMAHRRWCTPGIT